MRGTYATHGIDRYPAKMIPRLARYAIERVSKRGDTVLDPFCGCGTVLVESILLNRNAMGFDINPIAVVLARAKSSFYNVPEFRARVAEVVRNAPNIVSQPAPCDRWLEYWFTAATLRKLRQLRVAIESERNRKGYELLRAALIISVRKCSKADPRSPKPFISKRARRLRIGKHFDANRIFLNTANLLADASEDLSDRCMEAVHARTYRADARNLGTWRPGQTADAIVTSPPYLSAQDYFRSSKLELAIAGMWKPGIEVELGGKIIGSGRGNIEVHDGDEFFPQHAADILPSLRAVNPRGASVVTRYLSDMRLVISGLHAKLRRGGRCCLIVGDSTMSGIKLPVHEWFIEMITAAGFTLFGYEVDLIRNRRVPPQRKQHKSVIDREHLLFLRKD